jgi:hypothetical protein
LHELSWLLVRLRSIMVIRDSASRLLSACPKFRRHRASGASTQRGTRLKLKHALARVKRGRTAWTEQSSRNLKAAAQALAARAACMLAICSFIFCCISLGVYSAMWVATIQL